MLLWTLILCILAMIAPRGAEVIPPAPKRYFNDYAGVISAGTEAELNSKLEQFEKDTSSQVVVAIFQKMQSDSSVQDYTVRVAQAWKVGQQDKRNGAVLFLFIEDRQMFLQVGYGLEGAIPDAVAKQITEFEIKPRLQAGDFDGGLIAGVNAILQAARGEYRGTGRTVAQRGNQRPPWVLIVWVIFIIIFVTATRPRRRRGWIYRGGGSGGWGGGSGWGGGMGGGGGWSGGSGGGFSGGGGSFGGGGAGSRW